MIKSIKKDKEIVSKYLDGVSVCNLAEEYCVGKTTIYRVLERNNVRRRTTAESLKIRCDNKYNDYKEVVEEYKGGVSVNSISKMFGLNKKTIYSILRYHGVTKKSSDTLILKNFNANRDINLDGPIKSYIDGWLLGDGSLVKTNSMQTSFCLTTVHKEYADYVCSILNDNNLCASVIKSIRSFPRKPEYIVSTKRFGCLKEEYNRWYPMGKKVVPTDVSLDKNSLSNWIMDDGSIDKNHGTLHLYTCGFGLKECEMLKEKLNRLISGRISVANKKKYPYLYVSRQALNSLYNIIENCPVTCFLYKWGHQNRGVS